MSAQPPAQSRAPRISRRARGLGRVLVTVYAILAIGATSRAVFQLALYWHDNEVPITLSAISGIIYIVATVALLVPGRPWQRVAWVTISIELIGVLVVGTLSYVLPGTFLGHGDVAHGTVWSAYGQGYVYIPLVLPVLGLLWLRRTRILPADSSGAAGSAGNTGSPARSGAASASETSTKA